MPEETKNMCDVILTIVTMLGAAAAFVVGLLQWRKGLAWQRANKGYEMVEKLLVSNDADEEYYAWDAMKMLDYQDAKMPLQTKKIAGAQHAVDRAIVHRALTPEVENEADPLLLYVRECFDELYFRLGQLQDAIDNQLVDFEHVCCPLDYYAMLLARDAQLHAAYMKPNQYQRALRFLRNYPCWRAAEPAQD